ncbi:MAG: ATP-binding protein, partial [Pseudomonadota bacterium]|nr:ATP-binding protein [Pseudomonadota bacterium]
DNKASEIKIVLSSQAIELILKELFENSKKFHPEESPQIHIELTLFANRLRLRFSDNGVSLSPQQLAQMWLPYYQGEKYFTGEVAGVGLGLAMVASLVWEVGGQCRGYNRTQGHGIVIELMIPLPQYEF